MVKLALATQIPVSAWLAGDAMDITTAIQILNEEAESRGSRG